eukprot:1156506-Pelagomonas_calceolata.AAC.4
MLTCMHTRTHTRASPIFFRVACNASPCHRVFEQALELARLKAEEEERRRLEEERLKAEAEAKLRVCVLAEHRNGAELLALSSCMLCHEAVPCYTFLKVGALADKDRCKISQATCFVLSVPLQAEEEEKARKKAAKKAKQLEKLKAKQK